MPAIIDKILRMGEGKILRQLEGIAKAVNAIEDDFVAMSDDELRGMTDEFVKVMDQSIEVRARTPERYPDYMEDHCRTGRVLLDNGRYAEAIPHFQALLKLKPDHEEAKKYLAIAQAKLAESTTRPTTTTAPASRQTP